MLLVLLMSFLLSPPAHAAEAPPMCSREGFYFLGGYSGQHGKAERGIITSRWSPSHDPHFSSVYLSCSGKASKICNKTASRLNVTVRSFKPQYSGLTLESKEKNMVSFRVKKLDFMHFFPARVLEGTEVVLYVGTATEALCQHAIQIIP